MEMKSCKTGQFLMGALLLSAGVAGAADKTAAETQADAAAADQIRHQIVMYADYSIWDDVTIDVSKGAAHLSGVVTQPIKKEEIDRLARQVAGVTQLQDDVRVLPLSNYDDQLRVRIARAIYGDPAMRQYANQPLKPIHILVENGHVTLAGVVNSEFDKQIAGVRAGTAGASFGKIVNDIVVVPASSKKS
jgi:hyperosmotically inducible protein